MMGQTNALVPSLFNPTPLAVILKVKLVRSVYTYRQHRHFFRTVKNGFNAVPWFCSHVTSKRSKVLLTKIVKLTGCVNKPVTHPYNAGLLLRI